MSRTTTIVCPSSGLLLSNLLHRRFVFLFVFWNLFVFQPSFGFLLCRHHHPSSGTTSKNLQPFHIISSSSFRDVEGNNKNNKQHRTTVLFGYKFGDFTKGMINQVTGKKEYEFGDLTKWLDQRAKSSVENFTNKTVSEYEFGDITREVIKRLKTREYTMDDIMLIIKIVTIAGLNFGPIASILPGKVLIDILEVSIATTVGEKMIGTITTELDQRMKHMVTGDREYKFGDITKKAITGDKNYKFGDFTKQALLGKKEYEFGDLTRTAISKFGGGGKGKGKGKGNDDQVEENKSSAATATTTDTTTITIDQQTLDTLDEWDNKFLKSRDEEETDGDEKKKNNKNQMLAAENEIKKWDEKLKQQQQQQATTKEDKK